MHEALGERPSSFSIPKLIGRFGPLAAVGMAGKHRLRRQDLEKAVSAHLPSENIVAAIL